MMSLSDEDALTHSRMNKANNRARNCFASGAYRASDAKGHSHAVFALTLSLAARIFILSRILAARRDARC